MKRSLHLLSLAPCAFLAAAAPAQPPIPPDQARLAAAVALLEESLSAWEPQGFDEPERQLRACAQASQDPLAWYWTAVAGFHRILCQGSRPDQPVTPESLEEAGRTLDRALALDPGSAECHIMRGVVLGMRISRQPASALWLGRKLLSDQRLALDQGHSNPRVRYLNGVSIYRASKGKDAAKALAELAEAGKLFQSESQLPRPPLSPRWGFDHCLYLTGDICRAQGDSAQAREHFSRALRLNPQLRQAQEALRQLTGS